MHRYTKKNLSAAVMAAVHCEWLGFCALRRVVAFLRPGVVIVCIVYFKNIISKTRK